MSSQKVTNQHDQTIHHSITGRCVTITMLKVAGFVLGLLMISAGLTMYFLHVNIIAACVTGSIGVAGIVGVVIGSIIACRYGKNIDDSKSSKNVGVDEFTLDTSKVQGNPKISEDDVAALLRDNPNLKKLKVKIGDYEIDKSWQRPDFTALDTHFTWMSGQSNGMFYIYTRKTAADQ